MSTKHPFRTLFRAVAATAVFAGALMNIVSLEHDSAERSMWDTASP